ncbi:MAG: S49 family peptidase, partial [Proteobacteria bacterium]|nr:S49 family peptidase [Pseudomonadota bacterium]
MDNLTIEYGPTTGNNHVDQGPWALAVDYLVSAMSSNMGGTAFSAGREMSSVEDGSIAVISIDGVMSRGGSFWGGTSTASVVQQVHAAMGNPRIKGIVLSINSPGGYSAGTKELADAVSQAKAEKPVYASISDVGASAAYWVASQATKVFAAPDAIVGSIGTYTVLPDIHRMAENAGVTIHVIRAE